MNTEEETLPLVDIFGGDEVSYENQILTDYSLCESKSAKLVLIDTRILDTDSIISSLAPDTEYILFHFYVDTIADIQDRIVKPYESVAIIQHNYNLPTYQFVADCENATLIDLATTDPALESWREYIAFLVWLKTERGVVYVDLLACDLWANENWKYMIETVRQGFTDSIGRSQFAIFEKDEVSYENERDGVYIRASLDITGAGGDFVLESDGVDMVGIYFTEKILDYKYAFAILPVANPMYAHNEYYQYTLPFTNPGTVDGTRYNTNVLEIGNGTGLWSDYTNVVSVASNTANIAILRADGTVSVAGGSASGTMPCGIVTQADLVNITKIVGGNDTFVALKSNGTVICWGKPNAGYGNIDINTVPIDTYFTNVNAVRSRLVNVVDIYANSLIGYAALTSSGGVVTWGVHRNGGSMYTIASDLSSGVVKVYTGYDHFIALKNDGTVLWWGAEQTFKSTNSFTNSTPIIDVIVQPNNYYPHFVRLNNGATEIVRYNGSLIYTLPAGVKILRKVQYGVTSTNQHFIVLSNSTIVYISNTNVASVNLASTDVTTNSTGYAMITNGLVVGRPGIVNPVRLVSTDRSFGVLTSNNTFIWWGTNSVPYTSSSVSSSTGITINNVANVYPNFDHYVYVKTDRTVHSVLINEAGRYATKAQNTNVYFEVLYSRTIPISIPYAPTVSPSSFNQNTPTTISYYVSNPDIMAYVGRTYRLYNGTTALGTFYPTRNTHTYDFSDIAVAEAGSITLTIKDETNTVVDVVSFVVNVIPSGFTYDYTSIDLYSPTGVFDLSYNDLYYSIFFPGITYTLKNQTNTTLQSATVDASTNTILFSGASSRSLQYGPNVLRIYDGATAVGNPMSINTVCFREGTRILCFDKRTSKPKYIPIEKLKPGTLVKTLTAGFVPIKLIGHSILSNSTTETRIRDSLYKCSRAQYPELIDDLYITGNHSILVHTLSEKQRAKLGENVYMTEGEYRLPAWLDMRAERFRESGEFRIWHFALEHHDYYMNYGVYANGLLVESTSLRFMNELSGMKPQSIPETKSKESNIYGGHGP